MNQNTFAMFDVVSFLEDRDIFITYEGKNVSPGWIGISCPNCGDRSNHFGINLSSKLYSCWRCGIKGNPFTLIRMVDNLMDDRQIAGILARYTSTDAIVDNSYIPPDTLELPENFKPIDPDKIPDIVADYLHMRRYDPKGLIETCKCMWPGEAGYLKYHLIFPVFIHGIMVNFVAKPIAGQEGPPWHSCPNARAVMPLNSTLFFFDRFPGSTVSIIVEGVFDALRLGPGVTLASFGTTFTVAQADLLRTKKPSKVVFIYDAGAGMALARATAQIWFCPVEAFTLEEVKDPDTLDNETARRLVWEILK